MKLSPLILTVILILPFAARADEAGLQRAAAKHAHDQAAAAQQKKLASDQQKAKEAAKKKKKNGDADTPGTGESGVPNVR